MRPPRLGGAEHVGVFATRSPFRPNPIGLTCVKLSRVELTGDGPIIHVLGADLRDGTPIYDIKPYIPFADCHQDAAGGWIEDAPWQELDADFPQTLQDMVPPAKLPGLIEVLRQTCAARAANTSRTAFTIWLTPGSTYPLRLTEPD